MTTPLHLVAPDLAGRPTGGTLYNRYLVEALRSESLRVYPVTLAEHLRSPVAARSRVLLCDSLYLDDFPGLLKNDAESEENWLLLHYLPTFVRLGRACEFEELSKHERAALRAADGLIATGQFMEEACRRLVSRSAPVCLVQPGLAPLAGRGEKAHGASSSGEAVRIALVGSVTEAKGQLSFLRELGARVDVRDDIELDVVGSLEVDKEYAEKCRAYVSEHAVLSRLVRWGGERPHEETLQLMSRVDVVVSASRMEAFGMALLEARAAGCVVLSTEGGNAGFHVRAQGGAQPCADSGELAAELLALVRSPAVLAARAKEAEQARPARTWSAAARELAAALGLD